MELFLKTIDEVHAALVMSQTRAVRGNISYYDAHLDAAIIQDSSYA